MDGLEEELDALERILCGQKKPGSLDLQLLRRLTGNFCDDRRIGEGGCGKVYKGVLPNGKVIAVKKLKKDYQNIIDENMFLREVDSMIKVGHQNIIRFLGYCSEIKEKAVSMDGKIVMAEDRERLLCFPYISNGSLDKHLTDELRGFEWHTRYQIIKGICDGLLHLHKEKGIMHMDLKPANILLDDQMVPKITDFGVSRIDGKTQITSAECRFSRGHAAPEYIHTGERSWKSDIYSLGVIMIELVTGSMKIPNTTKVLRRWRHRWNKLSKHTPLWYLQVKKCLDLAVRCQEQDRVNRPFIWDVVSELNKLDSWDGQIIGSSLEKIISSSDDMLGIEPLELYFPLAHEKQVSCPIELRNDTDYYMAFKIATTSLLPFSIQPADKGIAAPGSMCRITIILPAQEMARLKNHREGFIVQSTRVDRSLIAVDITDDTFNDKGGYPLKKIDDGDKVVDEVTLTVLFGEMLHKEHKDQANLSAEMGSLGTSSQGVQKSMELSPHQDYEDPRNSTPTPSQDQASKTWVLCKSTPILAAAATRANRDPEQTDPASEVDIVVGALSGMVDALPGKLGELLEQQDALLPSICGDIVFLQAELSSMRTTIQHCESLDRHDSRTTGWIGLVREVAYDIQDWVDLFSIRIDGGAQPISRFPAWFCCSVDKLTVLPARYIITTELEALKDRVLEISEQRRRYRLGAMVDTPAHFFGDPTFAYFFHVDPNSLVGLDGRVEDVSKIVMDAGGSNELKIVSIVGMAGSGKTTLAYAVYRHLQADNTFQCSAFVSIGPKPDRVSKTVKDLLFKLGYGHRGGEDISQLIPRVREILEKKRYLIVIDDLRSSDQWEIIRYCFPDNSPGSSIITTTRNDALPTNRPSGSSKFVHNHKISLLSDNEAEELFRKTAFGGQNECPQHLQDAFTKVLRRCAGLPLAVVSIASKLGHNQSRYEWEKHGLNLLCSSSRLKQILDLSYNDLEPQLRSCLLYLSIFPENSEIETERLVRRWIAEGFIAGSKEETAISYLNELIGINLVQPLGLNHDCIPRHCRVHPVIYDFIVYKSMEDNFATLTEAQHVPNNSRTVRRLSLNLKNNSKEDQPADQNESTDLSHARSVTVFGHASATPHLSDLKVVRVLDLDGCNGAVCLDGLCKLVLLKYLSLKGTDVSELPEAIGDLRCLETLDVRSTKVKELPPSIVRLEKIMHLLAGSARLPSGMDKMKAIRSLSCAGTTKSSANVVEEFSKHDNLRELELFYYATETPGNEKQIVFPVDGLKTVKQLCIQCASPSVTFEPHVLAKVQALELRFKKGRADESSSVSGLEHLSSLKHLVLEFEKHNAGAMATVDAVRKATEGLLLDHQYITIKVDGKNY